MDAYDAISKVTDGHDPVIKVHVSTLVELLDATTIPEWKRQEYIQRVVESVQKSSP
jgi:hypothetical protein